MSPVNHFLHFIGKERSDMWLHPEDFKFAAKQKQTTNTPNYEVHKLHQRYILYRGTSSTEVHLVEFMYLIFTCMPGESYRSRLRSLLVYLCYVFRTLINSLVC